MNFKPIYKILGKEYRDNDKVQRATELKLAQAAILLAGVGIWMFFAM